MITTFPPKECGIAQFSDNLYQAFRKLDYHNCTLEILALAGEEEKHTYNPDTVKYELVMDHQLPSRAFWDAALFINSNNYSNVIIQQEFGISPIQWQLLDLARWVSPSIKITTVVHTPKAYPNIEEVELIRQFGNISRNLVFMSWHGKYSAMNVYGIEASKCFFIPHGVTIKEESSNGFLFRSPEAQKVSEPCGNQFFKLLGRIENKKVILSNGLIHEHKGYHRIVEALPFLVSSFPELVFLIVGKEHSNNREKNLLANLLSKARELGVKNNLIWYNEYMSIQDLRILMKRTDIYVTPYDEIAPTSGALLMAMAEGLAIISTPFRFAEEVLAQERGLFIPYSDVHITSMQFKRLLSDFTLRQQIGVAAKKFVQLWTWDKVAQQYLSLVTLEKTIDLTEDPFKILLENESLKNIRKTEMDASWTDTEVRLFNKRIFLLDALKGSGVVNSYVLYVDSFVQINAAIEANQKLISLGIIFEGTSILVNEGDIAIAKGPYENEQNYSSSIQLNLEEKNLRILAKTVSIDIYVNGGTDQGIFINFSNANRFGYPRGILGDSLRCQWDLSFSCPFTSIINLRWNEWRIPSDDLLTTKAPGQIWAFCTVHGNILKLKENNIATGQKSFYPDSYKLRSSEAKPFTIDVDYSSFIEKFPSYDINLLLLAWFTPKTFLSVSGKEESDSGTFQTILRISGCIPTTGAFETPHGVFKSAVSITLQQLLLASLLNHELQFQKENPIYYGQRARLDFIPQTYRTNRDVGIVSTFNVKIYSHFSRDFELDPMYPFHVFGPVSSRTIDWVLRSGMFNTARKSLKRKEFLIFSSKKPALILAEFIDRYLLFFTSFDSISLTVIVNEEELTQLLTFSKLIPKSFLRAQEYKGQQVGAQESRDSNLILGYSEFLQEGPKNSDVFIKSSERPDFPRLTLKRRQTRLTSLEYFTILRETDVIIQPFHDTDPSFLVEICQLLEQSIFGVPSIILPIYEKLPFFNKETSFIVNSIEEMMPMMRNIVDSNNNHEGNLITEKKMKLQEEGRKYSSESVMDSLVMACIHSQEVKMKHVIFRNQ